MSRFPWASRRPKLQKEDDHRPVTLEMTGLPEWSPLPWSDLPTYEGQILIASKDQRLYSRHFNVDEAAMICI